MKLNVKTLKGTSFEIEASPEESVAEVKKIIETTQGQSTYPADQQMLIYQGKILKDDTTLESNKVVEDSFLVIMLSKTNKASSSGPSTTTAAKAPASPAQPAAPAAPVASVARSTPPQAPVVTAETAPPSAQPSPAAATAGATTTAPAATVAASGDADVYSQAASNLVSGNNLEQTIQQILDMGGGTWERDTVIRALRAAYNNPERAIDYLYSGIPENVEAPPVARAPASGQQTNPQAPPAQPAAAPPVQPSAASVGPNANPLNLFPQGVPSGGVNLAPGGVSAGAGALDALRQLPQFQALLQLVQANPQILQPMLQELGKQNPQILRLIQENQAEFLRMVNESPEAGAGGNLLGQLAAAVPQTVQVTPEEREAIQRLEGMGFNRELVLEVFFACNKDEELAANYLLDHGHEFDEQQQ
ncbi:unnamed protein product [Urochloa decumbens]|uniref:Ubiquitin receptor RAD23 n=1 Tax=Urochloa decumbens TaxID=240449 RepID=A0ABC9DFK1_9POAL